MPLVSVNGKYYTRTREAVEMKRNNKKAFVMKKLVVYQLTDLYSDITAPKQLLPRYLGLSPVSSFGSDRWSGGRCSLWKRIVSALLACIRLPILRF